jgi:hypothetical protein
MGGKMRIHGTLPRINVIGGLMVLGFLSGCASSSDVFPLNEAAHKIGDPKIVFVRQGIDRGPVTITMPDGEILEGNYIVARDGAIAIGFSGGRTATAIGVGNGGVQFVAKGPRTEMLCRGSVSIGGHGNGQCQTVEGAVWAVSY